MAMRVMPLDSMTAWKAAPGYRTLAIDGGAVRFECPVHWVVAPMSHYVCVADRQPPDERCLLALSWRRIPLEATILSIPHLVSALRDANPDPGIQRAPVMRVFRPPLELAWTELMLVDPNKGVEIGKRLCLARSGCTQALIVLDFRPEEGLALFEFWRNLLATLAVGETIADPGSGRRRECWG
jgi:hypothetical protein